MALTTYIKKNTAMMAAIGAGDLAVEKLRDIKLPKVTVDPKVAQEEVQDQIAVLVNRVSELPTKVTGFVNDQVAQGNEVFDDLANRGKVLVDRIANQQATKDLQAQAQRTTSQAKGAATTAKKSAGTTKSRAKATTTSAKKTASTAKKATTQGAKKVGA